MVLPEGTSLWLKKDITQKTVLDDLIEGYFNLKSGL